MLCQAKSIGTDPASVAEPPDPLTFDMGAVSAPSARPTKQVHLMPVAAAMTLAMSTEPSVFGCIES